MVSIIFFFTLSFCAYFLFIKLPYEIMKDILKSNKSSDELKGTISVVNLFIFIIGAAYLIYWYPTLSDIGLIRWSAIYIMLSPIWCFISHDIYGFKPRG